MVSPTALARQKEIIESLKNWQKLIREYQKPDTTKAVIQILNTYGLYIIVWLLMFNTITWSIPLTLLLGFLNGFALSRLFIIQHDCGHQSFLKSRKWNNRIGFLSSIFTSLPYEYWARVHNYHHGHTGQYEERSIGDIDFMTVEEFKNATPKQKLWYRFFRHPIMILGIIPIAYFTINNRFPMLRNKEGWTKTLWSQFINNIVIIAVYAALTWLIGINFLLVQLISLWFFAVVAIWFFYVQHQHEHTYMHEKKDWNFVLAAIQGSSYYKLPRVLQWLSGNIGFHHIHHLSSSIPNYNLERCFKEKPILSKYVNVLTIGKSFKCIFANLWDEQQQRMISFKEYRKTYA